MTCINIILVNDFLVCKFSVNDFQLKQHIVTYSDDIYLKSLSRFYKYILN